MTSHDAFFESFINIQHTVLGVKLQPLSLRHLLWLYHIHSPLVETSNRTTLQDLEIAVTICASSSNGEILTGLELMRLPLHKRLQRYFWHKANIKKDLKAELLDFVAYQDDYVALPQFYESDDNTDSKIPWLLLHAATLIKHTGWSEETVLNLPVGKVIWLNLSFGYIATGESNIISDKELQAQQALKALAAV